MEPIDLDLPRLGLGAGPLGGDDVDLATARALVRTALDCGWHLVDTAPSYGASEARLGTILAELPGTARQTVRVTTKLGYGVPGVDDWTGPCIEAGVGQALERLGVDRLDIAFLHSCPRAVLEHGEVVAALQARVTAGTVAVAGYSGDNDAAAWAVESGAFGALQTSVNVVDRWALENTVRTASARGMRVMAKRSLSNAAWRVPRNQTPAREDLAIYAARWRATGFEDLAAEADLEPAALAIRWVVHHTPVATALVGTRRPAHIEAVTRWVEAGPLDDGLVETLKDRVREAQVASMWEGVI